MRFWFSSACQLATSVRLPRHPLPDPLPFPILSVRALPSARAPQSLHQRGARERPPRDRQRDPDLERRPPRRCPRSPRPHAVRDPSAACDLAVRETVGTAGTSVCARTGLERRPRPPRERRPRAAVRATPVLKRRLPWERRRHAAVRDSCRPREPRPRAPPASRRDCRHELAGGRGCVRALRERPNPSVSEALVSVRRETVSGTPSSSAAHRDGARDLRVRTSSAGPSRRPRQRRDRVHFRLREDGPRAPPATSSWAPSSSCRPRDPRRRAPSAVRASSTRRRPRQLPSARAPSSSAAHEPSRPPPWACRWPWMRSRSSVKPYPGSSPALGHTSAPSPVLRTFAAASCSAAPGAQNPCLCDRDSANRCTEQQRTATSLART